MLVLVLVALVLGLIELIRSRGSSLLAWAIVCLSLGVGALGWLKATF